MGRLKDVQRKVRGQGRTWVPGLRRMFHESKRVFSLREGRLALRK